MQANRNINLWQEKAPVYRLFRSKAPKTQQICHYRHARKTSELFSLFNTGVDFNLRNNFANSGSFAKVIVPVHVYNSLFSAHNKSELFARANFIAFGRFPQTSIARSIARSFAAEVCKSRRAPGIDSELEFQFQVILIFFENSSMRDLMLL